MTKKLAALVLIGFISRAMGQSHVLQVYHYIMDSYVPDVIPLWNNTFPLNVTYGFSLTQIIDVDEKNQILTTSAWLNQQWVDYNLAWDKASYGNISNILLPHFRIWKPDIVLYNNADPMYNAALMSTDVFVHSDGNITWLSAIIFKSSCEMNVRYYPFDEQTCDMRFASWAYDGTKMDLTLATEEGDLTNYMPSSEWLLTSMKVKRQVTFYSCCVEPFPYILITFVMKRRPLFYVYNLILPCVLITGLALLAFYMPHDSGEKVTLGITTVLSMTVFLMMVAENMPPTSETLPLIGTYYVAMICIVSFTTALTVVTLHVEHKGHHGMPVPKMLRRIAFGHLAPLLGVYVPAEYTPILKDAKTGSDKMTDPWLHNYRTFGRCDDVSQQLLQHKKLNAVKSVDSHNESDDFLPRFLHQLNSSAINGRVPFVSDSCSDIDLQTQFSRVLNRIQEAIEKTEVRLKEQDEQENIKVEWRQLAVVADRFFLVVFFIVTTVASLVIICGG